MDDYGRTLSRFQRVFAALGGADIRILAEARADTTEMVGRGIAAVIPAVFGGLAALIAFRYAYSLPLAAAGAAGAGWAVVVLCFDLSLMTAPPDRRRLSRLLTFGSRALVSVLAAFTFASAIVMFMFARDIAVQMAKDQQADLARYNETVIIPAYAGKITAAQNVIRADQGEINRASQTAASWGQQVATARVQATCEAHGVSRIAGCGQGTGLVGQGSVYAVRLAELQNDQAALASAQAQAATTRSRLAPQIRAAQAALSDTQQQEQAGYAAAQARYSHDDGLIARWRALGELESASAGVRTEVWLLQGLIIAIDLAAVLAKLSSKTPSYNRMLEACRKKLTLRAVMEEEDAAAAVELRRAGREATAGIHHAWFDAQVRAAQIAANAWAQDQQAGSQRSSPAGDPSGRQPPALAGQQAMTAGEQVPVAMAPSLRTLAWIGIGLLSALGGARLLARASHGAARER